MTPALRAFFDTEAAALEAGDVRGAVEANVAAWVVGQGRTEDDLPAVVCDRVRVMQRRAFDLADRISQPSDEDDEPYERASALSAPTLIIIGKHDLDSSLDTAQRWHEALPAAELDQWNDAAHLPSLERPERFTATLTRWVTQHSG